MNNHFVLFNSVKAAQEVAYSLRGSWDKCNGVEFEKLDYRSLHLAAAVCHAKYCQVGEACKIQEQKSSLAINNLFLAVDNGVVAAQLANCYNQNSPEDVNDFCQKVVKVAQDVASHKTF